MKKKCEKHEHLKLLQSQWRFDRELISKALQNISSVFPHYSRHDASHSKQIVVNIERILGDRIQHLTATDMWLILESAYCHDIGMVVTHKQIQDMDTSEFKTFISDIAAQPEHELNKFAMVWDKGNATLPTGSKAQHFFSEYKQILAEWYRRKHPQNADNIIRDPVDEIGLSSPRNELLPKRLFGTLAAICRAHGEAFEEVMKLPFSEAGMATEDCHPRYIAFLLRIADLLDVDDNRFCPVMMKMSGESLPASSHAHLEKHQGIKHFRLDSERIKIEVICPTPESYEVAYDWFKWLEKEYHSQSQHWPKIVPNKKLGRLPTLSPPKVSLTRPYLIINEGKRPSFDLDPSAMLRLLRGTGLYTSKIDSIREILQNAVDSTIISLWEQHKSKILDLNPSSTALFEIYDSKKIEVDFLPCALNEKIFTLTVKDQGTGISRQDLERMLKIGNSSKTSMRSRLIREMPPWFRPSGNFGIGLQSISLLSNRFEITTKSRNTHEAYKIKFDLNSSSSVVVEQIEQWSTDYGAVLSVEVTIEDFPSVISIPWNQNGSSLVRRMSEYDFTDPKSNLKIYEQVKIFQAIQEFNNGSPIKISSSQHMLDKERKQTFFSKSQNINLSNINFRYDDHGSISTLFRGQKFSDLNPYMPLISLELDFYGHEAMDFLTYNRDKILPHAKHQAALDSRKAVLEFIESKFFTLPANQRPIAAAFFYLFSPADPFPQQYEHDLNNYLVYIKNRAPMPLSEVIEAIKEKHLISFEIRHEPHESPTAELSEQNSDCHTLAILEAGEQKTSLSLIKLLATKQGLYWQEQLSQESGTKCTWSEDDIQPVSNELLVRILAGKRGDLEIGRRMLFPAWGEFRRLAVKSKVQWARAFSHTSHKNDIIVLPYVFEHEGRALPNIDENLIDWVYAHKVHQDLKRDEITSIYEALITLFSNNPATESDTP